MCGICGQYNFGSQAPVLRQSLEKMTKTLIHRGPDDEGFYIAGPLGLGFRRLSIIDLAGGHQPMSDQEETVWVVFNGEIYNFRELRRELEGHGHIFRTRSDTEVIVHGYKQWGDEVLNRLNGMFGLAIWDARQRRLVLARDPFGIKLLYYRIDADRAYFGSEIRAVRAATQDSAEVDPTSLHLFLRYRYTPSPYTAFKGIRKLAPGTKLTFEKGSYHLSRWYRSKPVPFAPAKSAGEAKEELLASSSIVPMYFVCERAREDVKVALIGQGPDELFGGYRRHLGIRYGALWSRLPSWLRTPISSTITALPRNETLKRGVYSLAIPDRMRRYQHVLSILPETKSMTYFKTGCCARTRVTEYWSAGRTSLSSWRRRTSLEVSSFWSCDPLSLTNSSCMQISSRWLMVSNFASLTWIRRSSNMSKDCRQTSK